MHRISAGVGGCGEPGLYDEAWGLVVGTGVMGVCVVCTHTPVRPLRMYTTPSLLVQVL